VVVLIHRSNELSRFPRCLTGRLRPGVIDPQLAPHGDDWPASSQIRMSELARICGQARRVSWWPARHLGDLQTEMLQWIHCRVRVPEPSPGPNRPTMSVLVWWTNLRPRGTREYGSEFSNANSNRRGAHSTALDDRGCHFVGESLHSPV